MAEDDRRVVGRPMVVLGGMTATPQGIAELQAQRERIERLSRPPPATSFASVLAGKGDGRTPEPSEKEKRRAALPKQGPRPGLVHPAQREAYGRADDDDETIVLKG